MIDGLALGGIAPAASRDGTQAGFDVNSEGEILSDIEHRKVGNSLEKRRGKQDIAEA